MPRGLFWEGIRRKICFFFKFYSMEKHPFALKFLLMISLVIFRILLATMLQWKKRKNKSDDFSASQYQQTINALRNCGLLSFFKTQSMRKELMLLENIIVLWDVTKQVFRVGPHSLEIDLEDMYFLTGLSKRGVPSILFGSHDTCRNTDSCVSNVFWARSHKTGGKIANKEITYHPLYTISLTIIKLARSTCPHLISRLHMSYSVECMEPKVLNWCGSVLTNFKEQSQGVRPGSRISLDMVLY